MSTQKKPRLKQRIRTPGAILQHFLQRRLLRLRIETTQSVAANQKAGTARFVYVLWRAIQTCGINISLFLRLCLLYQAKIFTGFQRLLVINISELKSFRALCWSIDHNRFKCFGSESQDETLVLGIVSTILGSSCT